MEEIEKRFDIIRAAVELSDYEVIDIQIKRLSNLSTDKHLHEILRDLESKNFRQALYQMRNYSLTLKDDFFDAPLSDTVAVPNNNTSSPVRDDAVDKKSSGAAAAGVNLFDLAVEEEQDAEHIISTEEMLNMTKESAGTPRGYSEPKMNIGVSDQDVADKQEVPKDDPLFSLDQDISQLEEPLLLREELTDQTVHSEESLETIEGVQNPLEHDLTTPLFADEVLKMDKETNEEVPSANTEETNDALSKPEESAQYTHNVDTSEMFSLDPFEELPEEFAVKESPSDTNEPEASETYSGSSYGAPTAAATAIGSTMETSNKKEPKSKTVTETKTAVKRVWDFEPDEDEKLYTKFAYMDKKFRNMLHQHPQKEELEGGICEEVRDFINFVSTNDYSESQVEAVIKRYQELKNEGRIAEAAQMLIAAATTESTFAQFMLARELFKGEVLQQNYPEAFTQINHLAEEDYPEAICDLGQLYEYGIGIDKNKRHAMLLYEEAAEMGIERARKHYERLKNTNPLKSIKSLTSSFLKRKNSV